MSAVAMSAVAMQVEASASLVEAPKEKKHTILYHGNCIDGWFSAYIAYNKIHVDGPVQMFPISPNQPRTWPSSQEMSGTHILLLDISVAQEYRDKWTANGALSILCIDHHASSIEHWSQGQCPIHTEMCAARQTHYHFYPEVPAPGWLHAIDRIDRWCDVTYQDRCLREMLSIIAHKPVRGEVQEAMAMTNQFIQDMNTDHLVAMYLQQGQQILDQKDAHLMQVLAHGQMVLVNQQVMDAWKLPETWLYNTLFILDNSNVSIDTTEAAHLFFLHQPTATVFINYRKQVIKGKKYPQYVFSARSRGFDITQGSILKGHPSAAGAMVIAEPSAHLPFVL